MSVENLSLRTLEFIPESLTKNTIQEFLIRFRIRIKMWVPICRTEGCLC